jgi:hypothetical protein
MAETAMIHVRVEEDPQPPPEPRSCTNTRAYGRPARTAAPDRAKARTNSLSSGARSARFRTRSAIAARPNA